MKRVAIGLMMLGSIALGGCQGDDDKGLYTSPKSLDKMSNEEWCAFYANYIKNPQLTPKNREIDVQRMKSRGCPVAG